MTDLEARITALADRLADRDTAIGAFLSEPDRLGRLRHEAAELEAHWLVTARRPPLWGIPVGVKDVLHVDGLETRAGSDIPADELTGEQATVVTALRRAGALVAGKTVTAQFAMSAPGATRNPHDLDRTPGGSSSGSAAAVAAGSVPLAIGTQTVGSTIRPAAYCGVIGFVASRGRISTDGMLPNATSFDTIGVFAADLELLATVAPVMIPDWQPVSPSRRPVLGVPGDDYLAQAQSAGRRAFRTQVNRLRRHGFDVVRSDPFGNIAAVNARHRTIQRFEFAVSHRHWYTAHPTAFARESLAILQEGERIPVTAYHRAMESLVDFPESVTGIAASTGVDIWVSPAAPGPAPVGLRSTGDPVMNLPWTQAGTPAISLPAGRADNGMPLGLQCCAAPGRDEDLLAWAPELLTALDSTD